MSSVSSSKSGMPGHTTAGILKRTSIYYTGPTTQHAPGAPRTIARSCCTPTTSQVAVSPLKPRNIESVPPRPQAGSWLKKQVAWADQGKSDSSLVVSTLSLAIVRFKIRFVHPSIFHLFAKR